MTRPTVARPVLPALCLLVLSLAAANSRATAQQDPRIRTTQLVEGTYMLEGNGGNIGLSVGEDGVFLIDDQFAPMVGQIKAAVRKLTDKEVRFVLNTHWHGDHTGGNERFGKGGAIIVAHENVRKRMSTEQFMKAFSRKVKPSPKAALPVITFADDVTFHWNGDEIRVFHVAGAHTDGDCIVWFKKANVIHTGDVFFKDRYPFIDISSGGSLKGMIAAVDRVLAVANDDTKIIPGHGSLADKKALQRYRTVLSKVHKRVAKLVGMGKTPDEVLAAKPTAEWDADWGSGFMKPEPWLRIVDESVRNEQQADRTTPGKEARK